MTERRHIMNVRGWLFLGSLAAVAPHAGALSVAEEAPEEEPRICKAGGSGLVLPLFEDEHKWNDGLRCLLYLFGLVWMFLGVGIVSDIFMSSIEVITSVEKTVKGASGEPVRVKIWNETVANLTLMALGSSAPEILLNVVEICSNEFFAGDLGPSTIVGSAAFNLLIIVAVCVMAIPAPDGRKIKQLSVFSITATCSVFAYLWLLVILVWNTPNLVDIWEAVLTFMFFPGLVAFAYAADMNFWRKTGSSSILPAMHIVAIQDMKFDAFALSKLMASYNIDLSDESLKEGSSIRDAVVGFALKSKKTSRAQYRMDAIRSLTGGRRVRPRRPAPDMATLQQENPRREIPNEVNVEAEAMYVLEGDGAVSIGVRRLRKAGVLEVDYETVGVTATAGSDFVGVRGTLRFEDGETLKSVEVDILDDDEAEDDETFFLKVYNPRPNATVGKFDRCMVTIIDDDEPGQLGVDPNYARITVPDKTRPADIVVRRYNGSSGDICVSYRTVEDGFAKAGVDFTHTEGKLDFAPGEVSKMIRVPILATMAYNKDVTFRLDLFAPEGVRTASEIHNNQNTATIRIVEDEQTKQVLENLTKLVQHDLQKYEVRSSGYAEQFRNAIFEIDGSEDGGDVPLAAYIMHIVSLPFKLLFATIPPTDYANAWPCFFVSLAYIGGVTAIIGDLASIFGCLAGLEDEFTAITFVALGTSLPDTFASKAAAESDETADASIGNVTGSNSVNVFLGLGLPWSIAAIYWWATGVTSEWKKQYGVQGLKKNMIDEYPEGGFVVIADSLGFSVGIFCVCAVICIAGLVVRRRYLGFELGGPAVAQRVTGALFVSLWCFYIVMSWFQVYGHL